MKSGFTLIELSVVLVIIGLIIGGILTGQELISAAAQRAQLAQIEKYNTAVHAFQGKYGYLPGDIPDPQASSFGLQSRGQYEGTGNGSGIVTGTEANCCGGGHTDNGNMQGAGETVMLWEDLSAAGLIDGSFNTATAYTLAGADVTGAAVGNYLPQAKIGQGNSVYIWAGGTFTTFWNYSGINYFGLSIVPTIASSTNLGKIGSGASGLAVSQAYNMDKKIDDGLPQSGNVLALYLWGVNGDPKWTDGTDSLSSPPFIGATSGSATTCYDNGHVAGTQKYSVEVNGGSGQNCALSFRFQ